MRRAKRPTLAPTTASAATASRASTPATARTAPSRGSGKPQPGEKRRGEVCEIDLVHAGGMPFLFRRTVDAERRCRTIVPASRMDSLREPVGDAGRVVGAGWRRGPGCRGGGAPGGQKSGECVFPEKCRSFCQRVRVSEGVPAPKGARPGRRPAWSHAIYQALYGRGTGNRPARCPAPHTLAGVLTNTFPKTRIRARFGQPEPAPLSPCPFRPARSSPLRSARSRFDQPGPALSSPLPVPLPGPGNRCAHQGVE